MGTPYKSGGPGSIENIRVYLDQELARLTAVLGSYEKNSGGLTTTVVVPCGTLTFTNGRLTSKGTC